MSTPFRRPSLVVFILAGIACGGSHRMLLPPRLNLSPYGQIGLVTFTAENAKGSLHEFATRRFSEYVLAAQTGDRKSTRLNSSHTVISYAVFCLKKKNKNKHR